MVSTNKGFTLVELLAVIAIIVIMSLALLPAISGTETSGNFNKALSDISITLTQARMYAMGHNTYVYVGLQETDDSKAPTLTPQTAGIGRVWMSVVASINGTAGYDVNNATSNPASGWTATTSTLVPIQKLNYFDNLHLPNALANPTTGTMARPTVPTGFCAGYDNTGASGQLVSHTPFTAPLGSASPRCSFTQVIQFDPQGAVSVAGQGVAPWVEIGLQPTHGNKAPGTTGNQAAVQVDGTTGNVVIYRI